MAIHDYVIANQNGANTRSDLNNAFSAIVSNNSSATEPTTTYAYQWWADTGNDLLKQRNAADSAWISILTLSTGAVSNAAIADDAVTLAKMAAGTDGELITYDTSGDPTTVPTGSSGEVLTSNGAGTTPTFQAAAGGGKVLQVLSTTKTDTWSSTSYNDSTFGDITGLSTTLTPASGSKVLISGVVYCSQTQTNRQTNIIVVRDSTTLAVGDANSSSPRAMAGVMTVGDYDSTTRAITFNYLDTSVGGDGSTAITYKIQIAGQTSGSTTYVNRAWQIGSGDAAQAVLTSTITVMEIGA